MKYLITLTFLICSLIAHGQTKAPTQTQQDTLKPYKLSLTQQKFHLTNFLMYFG